ncbi:TonB-dependent receptor [Aquabacterium sp. A7-Y]|uniref:TonB-dependent receptor domain-containing protein n=1 Tax=Aquabacterium sp. A7-Y TaxID=1349605 RepID=UPI00223D9B7B|nr:TonB-dependent receptor [Aquabacterium sp. A7-Y]MCW7539641.1 TonB-dependent receptor [Aquabacterium sp. A7-Y]
MNIPVFALRHGVLPPALAAALYAALPVLAQSQPASLPQTVVTAARLPQSVQDLVADVSVVTEEDIRRSGQSSLRELLQRLPGVQMSSNGSYASNTNLFIRGAELSRIVVLVDGVRIGSATNGAAPLENIPLAQIERIEVLRGPATTLYGPDAVGGVIQIFTRRGGKGLNYQAQVGAGSDGLAKLDGSVGGGSSNLGWSIGAAAERAHGISASNEPSGFSYNPDDDGYRSRSLSGSLNWTLAPGHSLAVQGLVARGRHGFDGAFFDPVSFGSPLGLTSEDTDAEARTQTSSWGVTLENRLHARWLSSLRLSLSDDKSASVYKRSSDGQLDGRSDFDTRRRQLVWQNTFEIGNDRIIAGLERLEDEVDGTTAYTVDERHIDSVLLAYALNRGDWTGQAALRRDDNSQFGGFTTHSLALGYRLGPAWRVTGSLASNFQAPTFNQLYYPGEDYGGNPALKPQRNHGRELALRYDNGPLQGSLTLYRNRIRGFIDPRTNVQSQLAQMQGATLQAGWHASGWHVDGSVDVLDAEDKSNGLPLVRRADRSAQLKVERQAEWGNAFAEWLAVSDREDYGPMFNRVRVGGYGIVNLGAQWRMAPGWTLLARLNNVGDKDYATAWGYSTLGRTVFAGLQFTGSRP